jgi:transposase
MRLGNAEILKMVLEHLEEGIPLHTLAAKYQYHLSNIKHFVALYRLHGKGVFVDRGPHIEYTREFKLNAIKRAMNENISYRKLAVELGLIDPHSVRDWLDLYEKKGEVDIQTTDARVPYLKHRERLDKIADKSLKDRLAYLEVENAYLKKLYSLIQKRSKRTKIK